MEMSLVESSTMDCDEEEHEEENDKAGLVVVGVVATAAELSSGSESFELLHELSELELATLVRWCKGTAEAEADKVECCIRSDFWCEKDIDALRQRKIETFLIRILK